MVSLYIILTAMGIMAFSGLPACFFPSRSSSGQRITTAFMTIGSLAGLGGLAVFLGEPTPGTLQIPWFLPWGRVSLDPLGAIFLGLIFVVPALGSIYGLGYWKQSEHAGNGRRLGFFYGLLAGSMAFVIVADNAVLFLIAWEVMALAAFFSATAEDDNPEVRRAGWVYLIATHIGTLCLFAMFALWNRTTGSYALEPSAAIAAQTAGTIFVLAVIGFGFKAGFMPLHVWLPGAHANAPSHVSAVMSGVMLKMGVYGILRMTSLFSVPPEWWGGTLLFVGSISGVAGIVYAIGQRDIKRLLAYSSIENIGIIAMGMGLALLGRSLGRWDYMLLGLSGSLLHVWNHGLFKSLLFFNAGAIIHAAGTRDMDRLGGLAARMPRTAMLFLIGAIAICALPPLNGFVGEWMLYLGFFRTLGLFGDRGNPMAAIAAVALAMIGAFAIVAFVKMFGTVFLGSSRSRAADHAHDPAASMFVPAALLSAACLGIGLFPAAAAPLLEGAARSWAGAPGDAESIASMLPLRIVTLTGFSLIALLGLIILFLKALPRMKLVLKRGTWDCGYAFPTARMQYTGSSFGRTIVGLYSFILRPKSDHPPIQNVFPRSSFFKSVIPDVVFDRIVLPFFSQAGRHLPRFRVFQQGRTHLYILYILIIIIVLSVLGVSGVLS